MQSKPILTVLLALLLTLALAVPALADGAGCHVDISSRLTDPTLDHSQGLTLAIIPQALRDRHHFVGHVGTTARAVQQAASTADRSFQAALGALAAFLSGHGVSDDLIDDYLDVIAQLSLVSSEDAQAAAIFSLVESQPGVNGAHAGTVPFTLPVEGDSVYVFDPVTKVFSTLRYNQ